MCAILGQFCCDTPVIVAEVVQCRDQLSHRGPDDSGLWQSTDGRIILAHRRLSILDLTSSGHQPMVSHCGRYVLVFNGEVYNYIELRTELQKLGHRFEGTGDTEVVLSAYIQWGDACLARFNGMFAIAIYDNGTTDCPASFFLARDRAGKKPLYISQGRGRLAFASELKAIPSSMRGELNLEALNFYLALGYIPGELCIASGVSKLPPAHLARYRLDTDQLVVRRWWTLPIHDPVSPTNVQELTDEAEVLLHDAVKLRLRSDVPVGVLLSGGLDSSLVLASAAKTSTERVKTFTIGFPGSKLDETKYAAIVAEHFNTEHEVLRVPDPSLSILNEFSALIDEPIADSSIIPSYLVSKMTARHVKVALGGDGGDELFGGYGDYTTAFADHERLKFVPETLLRLVSTLAGLLPTGIRGRNRLYSLRGGPFQSLVWGSPYFDAPARRRILNPNAVAELSGSFMAPELFRLGLFNTGRDPIDAMTRTHFGSILPDDFLVKVDRASMAVGLEMRSPLLDFRLIEFAFGRLPSDLKVSGGEGRKLQKLLGRRLLPSSLDLNRKQGFSIPLDEWLRNGDFSLLGGLSERLADVVNPSAVEDLILGHRQGRANGSRLFALMMLDIACLNLFRS